MLLDAVRQFPPDTMIAMEVCATSHYWGRTYQSMDYSVRLIPIQHVKALARYQKNDALAICETVLRPEIQTRALIAEQGIIIPVGISIFQQQPKYKTRFSIPRVSPLIAAAFLRKVNAEQFTNDRQLSAWCALVPRNIVPWVILNFCFATAYHDIVRMRHTLFLHRAKVRFIQQSWLFSNDALL